MLQREKGKKPSHQHLNTKVPLHLSMSLSLLILPFFPASVCLSLGNSCVHARSHSLSLLSSCYRGNAWVNESSPPLSSSRQGHHGDHTLSPGQPCICIDRPAVGWCYLHLFVVSNGNDHSLRFCQLPPSLYT